MIKDPRNVADTAIMAWISGWSIADIDSILTTAGLAAGFVLVLLRIFQEIQKIRRGK